MSQHIKTWQERLQEHNSTNPVLKKKMGALWDAPDAMKAEIADLRAALDQARRPDSGKVADILHDLRAWMADKPTGPRQSVDKLIEMLCPAADSAATEQAEHKPSASVLDEIDWCIAQGQSQPVQAVLLRAKNGIQKLLESQPAERAAEPDIDAKTYDSRGIEFTAIDAYTVVARKADGSKITLREALVAAPASADVGELSHDMAEAIAWLRKAAFEHDADGMHKAQKAVVAQFRAALQASSAALPKEKPVGNAVAAWPTKIQLSEEAKTSRWLEHKPRTEICDGGDWVRYWRCGSDTYDTGRASVEDCKLIEATIEATCAALSASAEKGGAS